MSSERDQSSVITSAEAMESYFGDFFGVTSDAASAEGCGGDPLPPESGELLFVDMVTAGHWLIPTLSTETPADLSKPRASMANCLLLLLNGLYLLRRPIAGRLRASVIEYCDERVMEFRFLSSRLNDDSGGAL